MEHPPAVLHHRLVSERSEPESWMFVLHGIYGAGRNWASIARRFVQRRTEWGVVLVDLRLHAGSQGFPPPHTLDACASDLATLAEHLGTPPRAILGHSFGGKVALVYAATGASSLDQVWVMDSTPSRRAPAGDAIRMLGIVRGFLSFSDRDEARAAIRAHGFAPSVANWMVTNLHRERGRFRWRFDLSGVEELMEDFFEIDAWEVVEQPPAGLQLHFVRATRSRLLTREERSRLEGLTGPQVHLHDVEGGHWLNADNPEAVLDLLDRYLP
jgi:pimeloyl-ACP methyl ester carboxylesterase